MSDPKISFGYIDYHSANKIFFTWLQSTIYSVLRPCDLHIDCAFRCDDAEVQMTATKYPLLAPSMEGIHDFSYQCLLLL